jgi:hypothetical protein
MEKVKVMIKDKIVAGVVKEFTDRSEAGIVKYGTTLVENNKDDFLQHLKEELMDAICYIAKLQEDIKEAKGFDYLSAAMEKSSPETKPSITDPVQPDVPEDYIMD